jgi:hypothetical protein
VRDQPGSMHQLSPGRRARRPPEMPLLPSYPGGRYTPCAAHNACALRVGLRGDHPGLTDAPRATALLLPVCTSGGRRHAPAVLPYHESISRSLHHDAAASCIMTRPRAGKRGSSATGDTGAQEVMARGDRWPGRCGQAHADRRPAGRAPDVPWSPAYQMAGRASRQSGWVSGWPEPLSVYCRSVTRPPSSTRCSSATRLYKGATCPCLPLLRLGTGHRLLYRCPYGRSPVRHCTVHSPHATDALRG